MGRIVEAEGAGKKIARKAEALHGDARARIAIGEALMRRLDGAREYRVALQDTVDALEAKSVPAAAGHGWGQICLSR